MKKGPDQTAKTPKQLGYWVRASRVHLKVDQSMLLWHIQQVVLDGQALDQFQDIQCTTVDRLTSDPLSHNFFINVLPHYNATFYVSLTVCRRLCPVYENIFTPRLHFPARIHHKLRTVGNRLTAELKCNQMSLPDLG